MFLVYAVTLCGVILVTESTKEVVPEVVTFRGMAEIDVAETITSPEVLVSPPSQPGGVDAGHGRSRHSSRRKSHNLKTRHSNLRSMQQRYNRRCRKGRKYNVEKCNWLYSKMEAVAKKEGLEVMPHQQYKKDKDELDGAETSSDLKDTFQQHCNTSKDSKSEKCAALLSRITEALKKETEDNRRLKTLQKIHSPTLRNFERYACLINDDQVRMELYDPSQHVCCAGLFNRTSRTQECCGNTIIDTKTHFCCGGDGSHTVYSKTEHTNAGCCGTFVYNTVKEICCQGQLYNNFTNARCCGDTVYNLASHTCCYDNYVHDRNQGDKCCGTHIYNSTTHTCCRGQVQISYGKRNKRGMCCGNSSIDSRCYKCSDVETVEPLFNESTQLCCNGRVKNKIGNNSYCCDRKICWNETQTQTTTLGHVIVKSALVLDNSTEDNLKEMDNPTKPWRRILQQNVKIVVIVSGLLFMLVGTVISVVIFRYFQRYKDYTSRACKAPSSKSKSRGRGLRARFCLACEEEIGDTLNLGEMEYEGNGGYSTRSEKYANENYAINNLSQYDTHVLYNVDEFSCSVTIEPVAHGSENADKKYDDNADKDWLSDLDTSWQNALTKGEATPTINVISNHFIDTSTQTGPVKECNRRNILGRRFDYMYILDHSNSSVTMPDSDVCMCLPISHLKQHSVETVCSTFRSLPTLLKKLNIPDDQTIASPVVEYALTGCTDLQDYARVTIPFVGDSEELTVWKFASDEGLSTTASAVQVPLKGKTNKDSDLYYVVEGFVVTIYTKSFSGFYCTTCKHRRELNLISFLFGSYKRFRPARHEVRLMLYIADEVVKFKDYKKRMFDIEHNEGRTIKVEQNIELPERVHTTDCLKATVTPAEGHEDMWIHKLHPRTMRPIKPELAVIPLTSIASTCVYCTNVHPYPKDIPYCVEWYMSNKPGTRPDYTFQCLVDISCSTSNDVNTVESCLVIDELQLRHGDRIPFEESEDVQRIRRVKEEISDWFGETKQKIVDGLRNKYDLQCSTIDEMFNHLQNKMTPSGIYEAITCYLETEHMYREIDLLQNKQVIPSQYFTKPTQRVAPGPNEIKSNTRCCSTEQRHLTSLSQQYNVPEPGIDIEEGATAFPTVAGMAISDTSVSNDNETITRVAIPEYDGQQETNDNMVVKGANTIADRNTTQLENTCRRECTSLPKSSFSLRNPKTPAVQRPDNGEVRREMIDSVRCDVHTETDKQTVPV